MKFQFNISIRQKLVLGYGIMVLSVLVISLYTIIQLDRLNMLINTSLLSDSRIVKTSENLLNSLVDQVSHVRKFIITGEITFKQLFEENVKEYNSTLDVLVDLSNTKKKQDLAADIKSSYQNYVKLVKDEFADKSPANDVKLVKDEFVDKSPANDEADKKRQQLIEHMSKRLRRLSEISQDSLDTNLLTSQKIGQRGTQVAMLITLLTVLCGSAFAFFITRSIYNPLQRLKEVTHYISHGDFSKKIEVERGDEIGDLSNSFNIMCDRLQELDRLKSDFISNITHDLKTPIASITEANQLVLDGASGSVSEQQQYLLNIIKEDSARLLRLIETIIDLSKMESGLLNYDLNPVEISHSVIEAIEAVKLLAKSKNILLSYGADKKLPRLLIDSEKMIQALINIFSNAIKFTPPGGKVSVEIRETKESAAQGGRGNDAGLEEAVKISISDTGPGIGQEDLPRIFEKFYRGHAAAATNGDGLGLTIVQHIIQAHGGRIWVDSQPGSGSKFNLLLPVRLMNS